MMDSMAKYGKQNPYHPRMVPVQGSQIIKHPLYSTWSNMKERCQNVDNPAYTNYGGRGIRVCRRWDLSFEAFAQDMGPKPTPWHTLDRFPHNDGNYEPDNCRWASRSEQMLNRRMFVSNTTGATGVIARGGRFVARVDLEKERHNLGSFPSAAEATAARERFQELLLIDRDAAMQMTERRARFDSSTGVRGVTRHTDGGFLVRKTVDGVRRYLGYRKTFEEALALWTASN
jgi:hypothetical protein